MSIIGGHMVEVLLLANQWFVSALTTKTSTFSHSIRCLL